MVSKVLFSSKKDDWETPADLFEKYNSIYHFTCDVCATEDNKKVANYISPEQNGLRVPWQGVCYCNPPYGREVSQWVRKASREAWNGVLTVMLLPARTDTRWFHDYIYRKSNIEIEFLKGRLQFVGAKHKAPFPSMIVVFKPMEMDLGY